MQIIEQNDKDLHRFETFENHVFHPFPSFKILILISLPPPLLPLTPGSSTRDKHFIKEPLNIVLGNNNRKRKLHESLLDNSYCCCSSDHAT